MGGLKKEGGGMDTPRKKGSCPSSGSFSTLVGCHCSVFPVQKTTTEQTRSFLGGIQKLSGGCVL